MRQRSLVAVTSCSTLSQAEFWVRVSGENVLSMSPACSAERQRMLICGGPAFPAISGRVVIFQKPGSIPSAQAAPAIDRSRIAASIGAVCRRLRLIAIILLSGFALGASHCRSKAVLV